MIKIIMFIIIILFSSCSTSQVTVQKIDGIEYVKHDDYKKLKERKKEVERGSILYTIFTIIVFTIAIL